MLTNHGCGIEAEIKSPIGEQMSFVGKIVLYTCERWISSAIVTDTKDDSDNVKLYAFLPTPVHISRWVSFSEELKNGHWSHVIEKHIQIPLPESVNEIQKNICNVRIRVETELARLSDLARHEQRILDSLQLKCHHPNISEIDPITIKCPDCGKVLQL